MTNKTVNEGKITPKRIVKDCVAYIFYELYQLGILRMSNPIRVMSVDETIAILKSTEKSLVRFGDGEFAMMRGVNLKLQQQSPELVRRMKKIVGFEEDDLMVSIPDIFGSLDMYIPKSRKFWRDHLLFYRKIYEELCTGNKVYSSTSFSRCYITLEDKTQCRRWFDEIKSIWKGKDVVVVEGAATHNGVTNDLLDSAKSIRRVICPPKNSYVAYDIILEACKKFGTTNLFLLSLGPTAKPLAEDLFHLGYRVIDIGNLDNEYEWFLAGTNDKFEVPKTKVITIEDNVRAGFNKYLNEVVERIEI